MDENTTYKKSYWRNAAAPSKAKPFNPRVTLTVGDGPITDNTIQKLSFLGNWCTVNSGSEKMIPCANQWLGRGPMQEATTHKCDYIWRCGSKREALKRKGNLYCPSAGLSNDTTYKLSYYGVKNFTPINSFKPIRIYEKSVVPMDDCSTYKLSYWPTELLSKENHARGGKVQYQFPRTPMNVYTTYRLSYWPNKQPIRRPFKAKNDKNLLNVGNYDHNNTTYNLSYFGSKGDRRKPIKPSHSTQFSSSCPLSHDTIHRLSYFGNWHIYPRIPCIPCSKQWSGRGAIQNMTTQKHDFTRKCGKPRMAVTPKHHLVSSTQPLESCTTQRLSYLKTNPRDLTENKSFKPIRKYESFNIPFEAETTMKLSYQPIKSTLCPVKSSSPSNKKYSLRPPFSDSTIHHLSYRCPGTIEPLILLS